MKTITGYKWLTSKNASRNGRVKWKKGEWVTHKGKLELCQSGLHACKTPLQSLKYIYGNHWWVVEAKGKFLENEGDKFVCSEMRIVKKLPAKRILVEFAIACAKRSLKHYKKEYPKDNRPKEAIEEAEKWLNTGKRVSKHKLDAAASAAWSAWSAAAWSAWSAAESAAASAAASAAKSAAASAAKSAAKSAEIKWQEKTLKKIINRYTKR